MAGAEPRSTYASEQRALVLSMIATSVLSVIAVVWGLAANSQIVLLDGVYAFLGLGLSFVSLRASTVVAAGPTPEYPFGRDALTPLVVGLQGLVLLGACIYAAIDAVLTILDGGSETSAGAVVAYGLLSFLGAAAVFLYLRRFAGDSDLVAAEALAWRVGALLSLGMLTAFGVVVLLQGTRWEWVGDYADPVMVLLACASFVVAPMRMIRGTYVEILEGAPALPLQQRVRDAVESAGRGFDLESPRIRMAKLGRKLYIEIDFVVPPGTWTVEAEDEVRHAIADRLDGLEYDTWITVELSTDPLWGA